MVQKAGLTSPITPHILAQMATVVAVCTCTEGRGGGARQHRPSVHDIISPFISLPFLVPSFPPLFSPRPLIANMNTLTSITPPPLPQLALHVQAWAKMLCLPMQHYQLLYF